jgi:transcription elongation GreA/GreB family factor
MKKVQIENEKNIFRDINSNALLFDDYHKANYEKRKRVLEHQEKEINTIKKEIEEIKSTMSKILAILEK